MSIPRPNGRGNKDRINVPCGKCPACLQNKRTSWAFRLQQELKICESANFITLTYNEENNNGSLDKMEIQRFLKRLRNLCYKVDGYHYSELDRLKLRYFLTGEYGSKTLRPHYHAIIFNLPIVSEMKLYEIIGKAWKKGSAYIGTVTPASIMYVAKYLLKGSVTPLDCEEPFSLMSRRPGIGYEYVNRMEDWHQADSRFYVMNNGFKQSMPRYYNNKIFSKSDREENTERMITVKDDLDKKRLSELLSKGINPAQQELIIKQDIERKIKNLSKKGEL